MNHFHRLTMDDSRFTIQLGMESHRPYLSRDANSLGSEPKWISLKTCLSRIKITSHSLVSSFLFLPLLASAFIFLSIAYPHSLLSSPVVSSSSALQATRQCAETRQDRPSDRRVVD